jgi:hypothetical protein
MDTHYKSNRQKKIEERQAIQLDTLFEKRKQEAEQRWVDAQIKAAGFAISTGLRSRAVATHTRKN